MVPIYSNRTNMNFVEISIPFETLLHKLWGVKMINIHGKASERKWKKYLAKIAKALNKSIIMNVDSDGFHKNQLLSQVSQLNELSKVKDNADIEFIYHLSAIIFELLGGIPDHRDRTVVNSQNDFLLTLMRRLHYTQTPYQKVMTILEASKHKPFSDFHNHEELEEKYFFEYSKNPNAFLDWYKNYHTKVYVKLF